MTQTQPRIGGLQIAIIVLTIATALIHLFLGISFLGSGFLPILFLLNAIGYLGLLGLLYLPIAMVAPYRSIVRWLLMIFTIVTIVAWLFMGLSDAGFLAYMTKLIEVVLVVLLFMDGRQEQTQSTVG